MEQLEDRLVPSSYSAANVSDLIADINASNLAGGSNTITLVAGKTFTLTAVDNTTDGATGLPVIAANDNLTILGNGDTIERSKAKATPNFRLLDVASGASLNLANLTVQGGQASGSGVSDEGGGIYNQGTLDLNGVTVQNNIAQGNGARLFKGKIPVLIAEGGGIYSSGSLTLEGGTKVQNNQALGGIRLAAEGGGIYSSGSLTVEGGTKVQNNQALGGQGTSAYWTRSVTLSPYIVPATPGGSGYGGGLYVSSGTVTLANVTLSGNTAQGGQGGADDIGGHAGNGGSGLGGGMYVSGGTVTLHNDTVTSNIAKGGLGGTGSVHGSPGFGEGGGLYIGGAMVYLDAFTLANILNNKAITSDPNIYGSYTLI